MLEWLASALQSLIDVVNSVLGFVLGLVDDLINFFKLLPQLVTLLTSTIGFLPSMLTLFATLSIAISVVFLTVGREHD